VFEEKLMVVAELQTSLERDRKNSDGDRSSLQSRCVAAGIATDNQIERFTLVYIGKSKGALKIVY
jgi:hypothetical protein